MPKLTPTGSESEKALKNQGFAESCQLSSTGDKTDVWARQKAGVAGRGTRRLGEIKIQEILRDDLASVRLYRTLKQHKLRLHHATHVQAVLAGTIPLTVEQRDGWTKLAAHALDLQRRLLIAARRDESIRLVILIRRVSFIPALPAGGLRSLFP